MVQNGDRIYRAGEFSFDHDLLPVEDIEAPPNLTESIGRQIRLVEIPRRRPSNGKHVRSGRGPFEITEVELVERAEHQFLTIPFSEMMGVPRSLASRRASMIVSLSWEI